MNNIKNKILDHQQYEHLTIDSWETNEIKNILTYKEMYKEIEQIYYYIKNNSKLPVGMVGYSILEENVIQKYVVATAFYKDKDEENINRFYEISQKPGFMFFDQSLEGEKFWLENPIKWSEGPMSRNIK